MTSRAECAAPECGTGTGDHAHTTDPGVDAVRQRKVDMRNLPPKCTAGFARLLVKSFGGYHVLPPVSGQQISMAAGAQH